MDSQRWASAEEDVTEGDLGLGKIAQLDICTGTAVCSRAGDKASCSGMDTQEGEGDKSERCFLSLFCNTALLVDNCNVIVCL